MVLVDFRIGSALSPRHSLMEFTIPAVSFVSFHLTEPPYLICRRGPIWGKTTDWLGLDRKPPLFPFFCSTSLFAYPSSLRSGGGGISTSELDSPVFFLCPSGLLWAFFKDRGFAASCAVRPSFLLSFPEVLLACSPRCSVFFNVIQVGPFLFDSLLFVCFVSLV